LQELNAPGLAPFAVRQGGLVVLDLGAQIKASPRCQLLGCVQALPKNAEFGSERKHHREQLLSRRFAGEEMRAWALGTPRDLNGFHRDAANMP
jgi:hypothetical protein